MIVKKGFSFEGKDKQFSLQMVLYFRYPGLTMRYPPVQE